MTYERKTDAPEDKRTGPKRKHWGETVRLSTTLDGETADTVRKLAEMRGESMSDVTARAVRNGIRTL